MKLLVLIIAAITTALIAGLFFAWSCSVTLGLAKLPNKAYILAFQSINREIQNPVFMTSFFGAALTLALSTFLCLKSGESIRFWLLLVATVAYLIGVVGVTGFGNVPMNENLDSFQVSSATAQEIAVRRVQFETPWNKLNDIRTLVSIFVLMLVIVACINPNVFDFGPKPVLK